MCNTIYKLDDNNISSNEKKNANINVFINNDYNNDFCEASEASEFSEANNNQDYQHEGLLSFISYNIEEEQNIEKEQNEYHTMKNTGDWYYAKLIISHAYQDKNNTDLFCDHLEKQFQKYNDSFDNIITVYYKNDLDIDIIYQFSKEPAKHLIDNLRIPSFKQHGYFFSNAEDANKWSFKIVIITNKGIYTANRYITDNLIGFY